MRLLERVRGFGRRPQAGVASRADLTAASGAAEPSPPQVGSPWTAEDYLGVAEPTADLEDHWAAIGPRVSAPRLVTTASAPASPELCVVVSRPDPVVSPAFGHETSAPTFDADFAFADFDDPVSVAIDAGDRLDIGEPDLPFFDPGATAAPLLAEVFAKSHVFRVSTRAGILALATAIPHRHGRERAALIFEEAMAEGRWPGFFRSWLRLAPSLECPRVIALAIELKEHWDESPHLWRFRDSPGRPSKQHESARGQLGWRRTLAMAQAKTHEPAWRILDDDLVSDWEDLAEPCPGFWSLAEWLEVACCADEAETQVMELASSHGRGRRALHLQEMCERLGLGRTGAAYGSGRMPIVDQDVTTFPFRNGHLRPGAGAASIVRRAPTVEEMQAGEVE